MLPNNRLQRPGNLASRHFHLTIGGVARLTRKPLKLPNMMQPGD